MSSTNQFHAKNVGIADYAKNNLLTDTLYPAPYF